jgi:5-methylcytosine-specific restriction endonuclease McrA
MFTKKYDLTKLKAAIAKSLSLRATLKELGLDASGNNYTVLHRKINEFKLNTKHFLGCGVRKGQKFGPRRELAYYLKYGSKITTHHLRLRLLHDGIFKHCCVNCKKSKWLGAKIPLELDHIDGDNRNNVLKNLRLLCPNCHALTPTHAGKNKGKVNYN